MSALVREVRTPLSGPGNFGHGFGFWQHGSAPCTWTCPLPCWYPCCWPDWPASFQEISPGPGASFLGFSSSCVPVHSLWYILWIWATGTAPGKWLMRLRVQTLDGHRPSFMQSVRREWCYLLHGLWLGATFLFCFIPTILSCVGVLLSVRARWDRKGGTRVIWSGTQRLPAAPVKVRFALFFGSALLYGLIASWVFLDIPISSSLSVPAGLVRWLGEPEQTGRTAVQEVRADQPQTMTEAWRILALFPGGFCEGDLFVYYDDPALERRSRAAVEHAFLAYDFASAREFRDVPSIEVEAAKAEKLSPESLVRRAVQSTGVRRRVAPSRKSVFQNGVSMRLTIDQFREAKKADEPLLDDPEIRRLVYPKVYWVSDRYVSLKHLAILILGEIMLPDGQLIGARFVPVPQQWVESMARYSWPIYFIALDFLEAVRRTEFPEGFDSAVPAGWLMFPRLYVNSSQRGWFCMVGRASTAERLRVPVPSLTGVWLRAVLSMEMLRDLSAVPDAVNEEDQDIEVPVGIQERILREAIKDKRVDGEECQILGDAIRVFFKAIPLMDARPGYVTTGRLEKRGQKSNRVTEFWTPTLIGARYRILHRPAPGARSEKSGIRRRPHWIRGHLRNRACGPRWQDKKLFWIEPCFCGLGDTGDPTDKA